MKIRKMEKVRHLLAMAVLGCLISLSFVIAAFADTASERWVETNSSEAYLGTGRVTFRNVRTELTGLYITKQVENASQDYPAPEEDEFTFTVKLDGGAYGRAEYTLRDANGRKIYNYGGEIGQTTQEIEGKMEELLITDRNGRFTLKAGQTACFEGLTAGSYWEVTEEEEEGYEKILPAADSAEGTLKAEGDVAIFRNLYKAPSGGGGNVPSVTPETGSLEVRKMVSFPEFYEQPQTQEFTFTVRVGGKLLSNEEYTLYDLSTGASVGSGKTGPKGNFTMQGGQRAVFTGLELDDYSVTEEDAQGWRSVTGTNKEGALTSGTTVVTFSNVSASFGVSKEMKDGTTPEREFTFLLTDEKGEAMAQVPYLLYNTALRLVDDQTRQTAQDGSFALQAGQTVIFLGLDRGTQFQVREIQDADYIQTLPSDTNGYKNSVKDNVLVYPFVNQENEAQTILAVNKTVINRSEMDVSSQEFTFVIRKLSEDGTYPPVADTLYYIGQASYKTDAGDGSFCIRGGQTARFEDLEQGTYQVEELTDDLPEGFTTAEEQRVQEKELEESVTFLFTNTFDQKVVEKTQIVPGDGEHIHVGDELTYEITGWNYRDKEATLVIRDVLDKGVELKEEGTTAGWEMTREDGSAVVTWTFEGVASGEAKTVQLHVTVTEDAVSEGSEDLQVNNQAGVRVGNGSWFLSDTIENPVAKDPVKTELTPGEGESVSPGDTVTYRVEAQNYLNESAPLVIWDTLDPNVELDSEGTSPGYEVTENEEGRTVLTWRFEKVQAKESRAFYVAVKIKEDADVLTVQNITNVIYAQVGSDAVTCSKSVINPLKQKETETESETQVTTETETESETQVTTETETESETQVTTETETETETEKKTEAATETEAKKTVKTGDETPLYTWIILAIGSAAIAVVMAGTVRYRRRRSRKG